ASLCWDERQSEASAWWQPAHVSLPTKLETEGSEDFPTHPPPRKIWNATPIATIKKAPAKAAIKIFRFVGNRAPLTGAAAARCGLGCALPEDVLGGAPLPDRFDLSRVIA